MSASAKYPHPLMSQGLAIPVIDLFAGPGGLGEGFASLFDRRGRRMFRIALSVEMDRTAHRTLRLRSFFRSFDPDDVPADYYRYLQGDPELPAQEALFDRHPRAGDAAKDEAWQATLGETSAAYVSRRVNEALVSLPAGRPWIMIGGPPCQAYSLVGRSRMIGEVGHRAFYEDKRHTLYQEYLRLIKGHAPAMFIMENVKGLLSSRLNDTLIFGQILKDLRRPKPGLDYRLTALSSSEDGLFSGCETTDQADPEAFLLRAENHGVPQARHRLIIVGVRSDYAASGASMPNAISRCGQRTCRQAIADLPPLRSSISRATDSDTKWMDLLRSSLHQRWFKQLASADQSDVAARISRAVGGIRIPRSRTGARFIRCEGVPDLAPEWFIDTRLGGVCNHESRSHIASDLWRYLFVSSFGAERGSSPKIKDFPRALLPDHANIDEAVNSRMFNDRFRVQIWDRPSTTVTSHISKDGHYFIHPDPTQARSLTVREAARLQTFPDNYFFEGPRTEQYHQVGNAVPPLLARKVAESVARFLDPSFKAK